MHFAQNLASVMEAKGLTKYRLAQMISCSQSTVAGWLAGREPRGAMRARLLETLDVSEDDLFGDNTKAPPPDEGEAEKAEFIRLYEAAPAWLQDQVRSLLKAAESGRAAPGDGPTDP